MFSILLRVPGGPSRVFCALPGQGLKTWSVCSRSVRSEPCGWLPAGGIGPRDRSRLAGEDVQQQLGPSRCAISASRRCRQRCEQGERADRWNGSWTPPRCVLDCPAERGTKIASNGAVRWAGSLTQSGAADLVGSRRVPGVWSSQAARADRVHASRVVPARAAVGRCLEGDERCQRFPVRRRQSLTSR